MLSGHACPLSSTAENLPNPMATGNTPLDKEGFLEKGEDTSTASVPAVATTAASSRSS